MKIVITPQEYKNYQPDVIVMGLDDTNIQSAINTATSNINSLTGCIVDSVWDYNTDADGNINPSRLDDKKLYRTDNELNWIKDGWLAQTQYILSQGNDQSNQSTSYSGGGVSYSNSMNDRDLIRSDVYNYLIKARVYERSIKFGTNLGNPNGSKKSSSDWLNPWDSSLFDKYISYSSGDLRYMKLYWPEVSLSDTPILSINPTNKKVEWITIDFIFTSYYTKAQTNTLLDEKADIDLSNINLGSANGNKIIGTDVAGNRRLFNSMDLSIFEYIATINGFYNTIADIPTTGAVLNDTALIKDSFGVHSVWCNFNGTTWEIKTIQPVLTDFDYIYDKTTQESYYWIQQGVNEHVWIEMGVDIDLSDYYTKTQIDTNIYTKSQIDSKYLLKDITISGQVITKTKPDGSTQPLQIVGATFSGLGTAQEKLTVDIPTNVDRLMSVKNTDITNKHAYFIFPSGIVEDATHTQLLDTSFDSNFIANQSQYYVVLTNKNYTLYTNLITAGGDDTWKYLIPMRQVFHFMKELQYGFLQLEGHGWDAYQGLFLLKIGNTNPILDCRTEIYRNGNNLTNNFSIRYTIPGNAGTYDVINSADKMTWTCEVWKKATLS